MNMSAFFCRRRQRKMNRMEFILCSLSIVAVIPYIWVAVSWDHLNEIVGGRRAFMEGQVDLLLEERQRELEQEFMQRVEKLVQERVDKALEKKIIEEQPNTTSSTTEKLTRPKTEERNVSSQSDARSVQSSSDFDFDIFGDRFAGIAAVGGDDFKESIDLGIPMGVNSSNVLVLYGNSRQLPESWGEGFNWPIRERKKRQSSIPLLRHDDALQRCTTVMVVPVQTKSSCLALVPYVQSTGVSQKWMRVSESQKNAKYESVGLHLPLRLVGRNVMTTGIEHFQPPQERHIQETFEMLRTYLDLMEKGLEDLRGMIKAKKLVPFEAKEDDKQQKQAIIVMVCNFGQVEILMNFACNVNARGLDTSAVLVIATDKETFELANSIGLAAYYNEKVCLIMFLACPF